MRYCSVVKIIDFCCSVVSLSKFERSLVLKSFLETLVNGLSSLIFIISLCVTEIYFENSVGIGEHPQHVDEIDKLIEKIATAEEKLQVLKEFE